MANEENMTVDGEYKVKPNRIVDLIAKILAVITAVFIWLYAVGTDARMEEKVFPSNEIEITGVTGQLSVIYGSGEVADVTVKGRYSDVVSMKKESIGVYVDASGITEAGQYTLPVSVKLNNGITLASVYPEQITVYVSVNQKKQIPVKVKATDYQIPAGSTLSATVKGAGFITAEGPVDVLDAISYACAHITPGSITDSVTIVAPVSLCRADGSIFTSPYVTMSQSEVTVKAAVLLEKEIPLHIESLQGYYNERNTQIKIAPETITVRGEASAVSKLDKLIVATVDETKITSDTAINAAIVMPNGVENVSGYESASIEIKHTGTVTRDFVIGVDKINVKNPPTGKEYRFEAEFITVRVRMDADSSYTAFMTEDDINVSVDLAPYAQVSGRYSVNASIVVKNNGEAVYPIGSYILQTVFS